MRILDRYLIRETLKHFLVVLFITTTLLAIGRVFEKLGEILEAGARMNVRLAATYILCMLPFELAQAMPLVVTLSLLLTIGGLARQREIIAMLCGGVSAYRIAAPILGLGLVFSATLWGVGEWIVPWTQERARLIDRVYIRGKEPARADPEFVAPGIGSDYFFMSRYLRVPERGIEEMREVTVWWVDPRTWRMERRIDAESASFRGSLPDDRTLWEFSGAVEQAFEGDGAMVAWQVHPGTLEQKFGPSLNLYLRERRRPEEMNSSQLYHFIGVLESRGEPAPRYRTELHLKVAFPLGVVLLSVIAFACGLRAQYGSFVQGVSSGLLMTALYFLATAVMQAIGHTGIVLAPEVCAWTTNVLFAVLALWMMARVGQAR